MGQQRAIGIKSAIDGMSASAARAIASLTLSSVLLSACHSSEARDRCGELSQALYEARQSGLKDRIAAAVASEFLSAADQEELVSAILLQDLVSGMPVSRRRYLSVTSHEPDIPSDWYSVRQRYKLQFSQGESWEEVSCHVDSAGRVGSIVGAKFGPPPAGR